MIELSVIIVSYNVRYFLEQCLLSVEKASENISCEIYVVDNNSADGSCSMVTREFPAVKLIRNSKNKGFAAANNQALKLTSGNYILLLNPDTLVDENTFAKCISFMDEHPDAGGMGVRMINGKGRFLPESKRSFPTPLTAFFKVFGFSYLFPKSGFFNNYYLGNLDNLKIAKVDVLTGAFMFLRKEAVLKTGLMDENFFMYGEDIDYSYRLIKSGFSNYYYPEVRIIHYKGESAKKGDLNLLVHFYKAMIIFVRKHFSKKNQKVSILPLHLAIFFRAAFSFLRRILGKIFLLISDAIIIYLVYRVFTALWQIHKYKGDYIYPDTLTGILLPGCTLILIGAIFLVSGYKMPSRTGKAVKGMLLGTVAVLMIYALLPLNLRFSRAIILLGGLGAIPAVSFWRFLISLTGLEIADNPFAKYRKTIIISNRGNYEEITKLISSAGLSKRIAGRVSIDPDDMSEEVLGNIQQIREVIRINKISEVIFTTNNLSASQIIDLMHNISDMNVTAKIASAGGNYILGSRSVNTPREIIPLKRPFPGSGITRKFLRIFR